PNRDLPAQPDHGMCARARIRPSLTAALGLAPAPTGFDQNVAGGRPGGERRAVALSAIDQASRRTSSPPVQLTRTNEVSGRHNIHAGSGGFGFGGRVGDRRPDDRDLPGLTVITRRGALVRA